MKIKYMLLASISGAIVALDQLTKTYIHTHFFLGQSVKVIPGFFDLTYVKNPGAAFGILATSHQGFRESFFAIIPIIALTVILGLLRTTPDNQKLSIFSLSLVFGGAIGNYIDRLRFKYVVDFLYFHYNEHYFPAFNVADSAIVVGVCLLLLQMILSKQTTPNQVKT